MDMVEHSSTHRCDGSGESVVLTSVLHMVQGSGTHRFDGSVSSVGSQMCCIWFIIVVCVVSQNSPEGSLLYLYVSHSTSALLAPGLKGSLYTATGWRYVSEFVPSA